MLRIAANGVHPVLSGARLGRLRQRGSFVPLGRVAEAGGCVPQTLVVVHRLVLAGPACAAVALMGGWAAVRLCVHYPMLH